jgi:hypothetical protein
MTGHYETNKMLDDTFSLFEQVLDEHHAECVFRRPVPDH